MKKLCLKTVYNFKTDCYCIYKVITKMPETNLNYTPYDTM